MRRTWTALACLALALSGGTATFGKEPAPATTERREFVVQPTYLRPSDQEYVKEYEEATKRCVREVRDWYRKQCGVTFRTAPLKVVKAKQTYREMRWGKAEPTDDIRAFPNWHVAVLEAIGGQKDRHVAWVFAQGGGGRAVGNLQDDFRGYGIFGDWVLEPLSGVENPKGVPAKLATWEVKGGVPMGTTVHELAHAFGLHHPEKPYPGKSLMRWHGDYPEVGFLDYELLNLRASPFFGGQAPDARAPYPSFATVDSVVAGTVLDIPGKRFRKGDVVEFVHVVDGKPAVKAVTPHEVTPTRLRVRVPDVGPGHIRVRHDDVVSHAVPLNVLPRPAPK